MMHPAPEHGIDEGAMLRPVLGKVLLDDKAAVPNEKEAVDIAELPLRDSCHEVGEHVLIHPDGLRLGTFPPVIRLGRDVERHMHGKHQGAGVRSGIAGGRQVLDVDLALGEEARQIVDDARVVQGDDVDRIGQESTLRPALLGALREVLYGAGECAEVMWTFLGISIPGWALIWFSIFTLGTIGILVFSHPRKA